MHTSASSDSGRASILIAHMVLLEWPLRTCFLAALLFLFSSQVDTACEQFNGSHVCQGGSIKDLDQIPDDARNIVIKNMPVGRVTGSLFKRFAGSLESLSCWHCELTSIERDAFSELRNLQSLVLDHNQLTGVPVTWFEETTALTRLSLGHNKIKDIHDDAFGKLANLTHLNLYFNELTKLRAALFGKTTALEGLDVHNNEIEEIERHTFAELKSLKDLELSGNKLKRAEANWFGDTVPLIELDVDDNQLEFFDVNLIIRAPSLNYLDLAENKLQYSNLMAIVSFLQNSTIVDITGQSELHTKGLEDLAKRRGVTIQDFQLLPHDEL